MLSGSRGFTLVEIVVSIAVIALLSAIIHVSLMHYTRRTVLRGGASQVTAVLNDARTRTLSGKNGLQYGVFFGSTSTTLFQGSMYSSTAVTNEVIPLDSRLLLSATVAGGASSTVFAKLDGDTTTNATITISVIAEPSLTETIVVQKTGIVSYN